MDIIRGPFRRKVDDYLMVCSYFNKNAPLKNSMFLLVELLYIILYKNMRFSSNFRKKRMEGYDEVNTD